MIVKWRGDEENGRDTLDTILREVVVISDSESDEESDDEDPNEVIVISPRSTGAGQRDSDAPAASGAVLPVNQERPRQVKNASTAAPKTPHRKTPTTPGNAKRTSQALRRERREAKKAKRGFKRYQAAWEQAVDRNRHGRGMEDVPPSVGLPTERSPVYGSYAPTYPNHSTGSQPPHQSGHVHSDCRVIYVGPARRLETTNPGFAQVDGQYPAGPPNMSIDGRISPRLVQPRMGDQRAPITTRSLTNPSLPVERSHGPNYQDLLVPSIEGPSPSSMAPHFVRSLPPRKHARDESPGHSAAYPPHQPFPPAYAAEAVQDGQVKRRRVVSDRDGMAGSYSDSHIRSPPFHNPPQFEPEIRQPVSYPPLDPEQSLRDHRPRQVYYERYPRPVESRERAVVVRQSNGVASHGSETIELRRGVQELPCHRNYHLAERVPEPPREYRGAPVLPHHPERHDQGRLAPHYPPYERAGDRHQSQQVQRPSAQPIFVRTVEPRTVKIQPRGSMRDNRYAAPREGNPSQRWEELPAEHPSPRRSLEP